MRDTVYLGYHPNATWHISEDNESYGEKITTFDTSYFNATWIRSSNWEVNQTRNTRVASLHSEEKIRVGSINFHKAVYPLFIYWDVERLRSDSMPFEYEPFSPRSMILWEWNMPGLPGSEFGFCNTHDWIYVADTSLEQYCSARDSLYFTSGWMEEGLPVEYFNIEIIQYIYPPPFRLSLEDPLEEDTYTLYPNPAKEHLILSMDKPQSGTFKILTMNGKVLKNKKSKFDQQAEFSVEELHPGSYWFWAEFENGEKILEKFTVSH